MRCVSFRAYRLPQKKKTDAPERIHQTMVSVGTFVLVSTERLDVESRSIRRNLAQTIDAFSGSEPVTSTARLGVIEADHRSRPLCDSFCHSLRTQWATQLDDGVGNTFLSTPVGTSTLNENSYTKVSPTPSSNCSFCPRSGIVIYGPQVRDHATRRLSGNAA